MTSSVMTVNSYVSINQLIYTKVYCTNYSFITECTLYFFFAVALRPNAGHGLLIHEVSGSYKTTPHSVGLLWTSDQLVAETST
jgi:hypothetical protein